MVKQRSGRETLASIDEAAGMLRGELRQIDARIQKTSAGLLRARQAESEAYRALAKIRIEQLSSPELVETMDRAEREVVGLLDAREKELAALEQTLDACREREAELERGRDSQTQAVEEAERTLGAAEDATAARLANDQGYVAQSERARTAVGVARAAEEKAAQAAHDRVEKGVPYEADRLFMYLWNRGYGTPQYRAWPVARYLDGKVAGLCSYFRARPNYAMLLEIPVRLGEHAADLRARAEAEIEALRKLGEAAAEEDGHPALCEALAAEREKRAKIDADINAEETRFQELVGTRASYAGGEDEYFRKAIQLLEQEFKREGIEELRWEVEATPRPEDDAIVADLAGTLAEKARLEQILADTQELLRSHQRRLTELESVRRTFKENDFDGAYSFFDDGSNVTLLMGQFLQGVLNSGALWRLLQSQQEFRRPAQRPGFGEGLSFGSSSSGHGVFGGSGGFGKSFGAGDGFHTGGSVGGGGFRTGGGF